MRAWIVALLVLVGCQQSRDTLHVYAWAEYFDPAVIHQFEEEYQCRVVIDTFDSYEAMYTRIRAGAPGYDLVTVGDYFVDIMFDQDLLGPIEIGDIGNLEYLDHNDPTFESKADLNYAIPYMQTYLAMGYRKSRVNDPQPTWAMFGRSDLRGRMTMFNDMRDTMGSTLKYLGYSVNTTDPAEIDAAADQLIKWKRNLAKFETEQFKNGLATAEFLLSHAYAGDIVMLQRDDDDIELLIPEEGTVYTTDFLCIPHGANRRDLAHKFIDFLYRPEVAAANIEYVAYRMPHTGVNELLSAEMRSHPAINMPSEVMAKSERTRDVGEDNRLYVEAWERVKANSEL